MGTKRQPSNNRSRVHDLVNHPPLRFLFLHRDKFRPPMRAECDMPRSTLRA